MTTMLTPPTADPMSGAGHITDLMRAVDEIREHLPYYQLAEDYYEGRVPEQFTSQAVRRYLRSATPGFDLQLAGRAVDAVLERLEVTSITVGGQDATDEAATQEVLDRVWNANRMGRRSKSVHRGALMFGDAYLFVWPGDDDAEGAPTVQLRYCSPKSCRVFYDDEDPDEKSYAAKLWRQGVGDQAFTRVNLYYADRVERYATAPGIAGDHDSDFTPYDPDGDGWSIPNPYGQVPVFHFRTDDPYGHPEHRKAWAPQNSLTKLCRTLMASVDFAAFPQRWALQAGPNPGQSYTAILGDDETADPNDRDSSLTATPGGIWKLGSEVSEVGQFTVADQAAFLEPAAFFIRGMSAATGIPPRFFDPAGEVPSGEALRADEAPLASRILDREEWLEETWNDALVFACEVLGLVVVELDLQWAPVQIISDEAGWRTVALKLRAGVPVETVLREAGYLTSVVNQWRDDGELDAVPVMQTSAAALPAAAE